MQLWNFADLFPNAVELSGLTGVPFEVIKRYEPAIDGYSFLHGVALDWRRDRYRFTCKLATVDSLCFQSGVGQLGP